MIGRTSLRRAPEATERRREPSRPTFFESDESETEATHVSNTSLPLVRSPSLSGLPSALFRQPPPALPPVFTKKDLLSQGYKHRLIPRGTNAALNPAISSLWGPRGHTLCASRFDRGTYAKLRLGRRDGADVAIREVSIKLDPNSPSTLSSYDSEEADDFSFSRVQENTPQTLTLADLERDDERRSQTIAKVDFDQFLKELNAQRLIEPAMTIHDVFYARGRLFTVMKLFAGSSDDLARLASEKTLRGTPLRVFLGRLMVRDISYALLRGLSHNLGHHDVSSRNILWDHDGAFYLADYGLVEQLSPRTPMQWSSSSLAAPEHFYPCKKRYDPLYYDERLDVWALGVSWLQMISREAAEIFYEFRTRGEKVRDAERSVREAVDAWQGLEGEPSSSQSLNLPAWRCEQLRQALWGRKKALQDAMRDVKHLRRTYRRFLDEIRVDGKPEPALIGFSLEPKSNFDFHDSLQNAAVVDPEGLSFILDSVLTLDPKQRASTFEVASFFGDFAPQPSSVLFRDVQQMVDEIYRGSVLPSREPSLKLLRKTESMMPACYKEYGLASRISA